VAKFAEQGIRLIVCLLNDFELRSIGTNVKDYEEACRQNGIELFKYPLIEMAPPTDLDKWGSEVVGKVVGFLLEGAEKRVLVHCRGGVGRAGTLACNVLSQLCQFKHAQAVIDHVRGRRDRRCVESQK